MITSTCPHCRNRLSLPDATEGTTLQCPICAKWGLVTADARLPDEPREVVVRFGGRWGWREEWGMWWPIIGVFVLILLMTGGWRYLL